ncbi:MAG TPA: hypothetical protein VIA61_11990 [Methylomirabilota bacterium]|jgi:hypothetical protein
MMVSATATGAIVFAFVFGGSLLGLLLRSILPDHHRSSESKDVVKLGMGLLATMAALVLGLLISSAKGSYDRQSGEVAQLAANVTLLDRVLAHYGPEARDERSLLRRSVARVIDQMWPPDRSRPVALDAADTETADLYERLHALSPQSEAQRSLRMEALRIATELGRTRTLLAAQAGSSIPRPFLIILVFWITVIFMSFGLFAPANTTVVATLFVCALSVSGATFLILELDQPFGGFIQLSSEPMRSALAKLGQ